MAGIWTEERRARAREVAQRVKPWLKSTGPKTPEGKAVVARNAYRGGVRPLRRAVRRACKADMKALDYLATWEEMEGRLDAWFAAQLATGKVPTDVDMRRAGLLDMRPPCALPAELIAEALR